MRTKFHGTHWLPAGVASLFIISVAATRRHAELALAERLETGMQLIYASNGQPSPPWIVDSVERPVRIGGRDGCARIRLRTAPDRPAVLREWCIRDRRLEAWSDSTMAFRVLRPVGPGIRLEMPGAGGGAIRYETTSPERDVVNGVELEVIPTTVLTIGADSLPIRRLRERFSVALATATAGVFEMPDSASPGGWRTMEEFRLVEIRRPGR